ncbi:MAG: Rv3654c family TadE-like protein [Actinomycetota bacterium]
MESERGSTSLAMLGALAVALAMLMFLVDLGVLIVARTRAQTAADAAALAAAGELAAGGPDPQGEAGVFARANGARLIRCDCSSGSGVEARVLVLVPARFGGMRMVGAEGVTAWAKARVTPLTDSGWSTSSPASSSSAGDVRSSSRPGVPASRESPRPAR